MNTKPAGKGMMRLAVMANVVLAATTFVILVGVTSQPNSGAIPAGIFILPMFLFACFSIPISIYRILSSGVLSTSKRTRLTVLLVLSAIPYIWWFMLPG
jgi:hypothetical protein